MPEKKINVSLVQGIITDDFQQENPVYSVTHSSSGKRQNVSHIKKKITCDDDSTSENEDSFIYYIESEDDLATFEDCCVGN